MITISNCPVCNSNMLKQGLVCKDYLVTQKEFTLTVCETCDFTFTNPRPNDEELGNYYKSENYISHSNTKQGIVSRLYHLVRSHTLKGKVKLVSKYVSRGTILDYGCGTGMFLNEAAKNGFKSYGIEPEDGAREFASKMDLKVFKSKEDVSKELSFDTITLWHVLEHVTDLGNTLSFFNERLNKNGMLIIAVPNHKSFDAKHYGKFWAAYDVPRHLYHFDKTTVEMLLNQNNFILKELLPMKFDSFYVSMLSEKYLTGSINYFKAFFTGLKSI